jgi:hypothetical protein
MIELKWTEACDFEFDMQMNGGQVGATPQVIFCMETSSFGLTFPCIKGDHGQHSVKLPCFQSLGIAPAEYPCRIMVILGESVFFPYTDTIVIKEDPRPVINAFARATPAATGPTVTMTSMAKPTVAAPAVEVECTTEATKPATVAEPIVEAPVAEPAKAQPAAQDVAFFSSLLRRKAS